MLPARHVWTFGLSTAPHPDTLKNYLDIDLLVASYFALAEAAYCGDNGIFIRAKPRC